MFANKSAFMGKVRFQQVVFMDDFFRSADNGLQSHPSNRQYLRKLFESAVVRLGMHCREAYARSDGGTIDVAAVMAALGLPCSEAGWARASSVDLGAAGEAGLLLALDPGTLVIGWGMPVSLMNYADRRGAAFIDLEIDPIRFTRHLKFCARTNDRAIERVLASLAVEETEAWNDAAALKGYFARRGDRCLLHPELSVGLFVGQTSIDLSLVAQGVLKRPIDVLERVDELARSVDLLVFKTHPYESSLAHVCELADRLPNVAWTSQNIYALLCAENLRFVCGLSSGALREAGYFLRPAEHLIQPDRNDRQALPSACSDWIAVPAVIASFEVMIEFCKSTSHVERMLRALSPGRVAPAQSTGHFRADALDHAFGFRWGLDAAQTGLPALPRLKFDQTYGFGSDSPVAGWLAFGWSAPEAWGVWSDGERACLVIPLENGLDNADGALEVHLEGQLFGPEGAVPPEVMASVNGIASRLLWVDGDDIHAHGRFVMTASLADLKSCRVLVINFSFRNPLRPVDFGLGPDARRLAFGLKGLRVSTTATVANVLQNAMQPTLAIDRQSVREAALADGAG